MTNHCYFTYEILYGESDAEMILVVLNYYCWNQQMHTVLLKLQ